MNKYVVALGCSWTLFWKGGLFLSGLASLILCVGLLSFVFHEWPTWRALGAMAAGTMMVVITVSSAPLWMTILQPPLFWLESRLKKLPFWTT